MHFQGKYITDNTFKDKAKLFIEPKYSSTYCKIKVKKTKTLFTNEDYENSNPIFR